MDLLVKWVFFLAWGVPHTQHSSLPLPTPPPPHTHNTHMHRGDLDCTGSDNVTYKSNQKALGAHDFRKIPNGVTGNGNLLSHIYSVMTGTSPYRFGRSYVCGLGKGSGRFYAVSLPISSSSWIYVSHVEGSKPPMHTRTVPMYATFLPHSLFLCLSTLERWTHVGLWLSLAQLQPESSIFTPKR